MKLAKGFLLLGITLAGAVGLCGAELVRLDKEGVIRWCYDGSEVALFGANYCLPSACDYRAAGYVGADRRELVRKDLTHFARMGWDGMRLCLWGDWENCDTNGNLIVNEHLELMDFAIAEAGKRGIYILLTPITTYSAWWPDGKPGDSYPGFSKIYERWELGMRPDAIAAESNYLHQIFSHVNPFTGTAIKDEPSILFVEMINEPIHRSDDLAAAIAYINTLADAVRSTGCKKILFHNVSQDFRITPAIKASKAQGVSFAWYPTGLNANRSLSENYLRTVDDYPPMLRQDLLRIPKLVYEFDSPDVNSAYMYPAMVRAFRGVGAQFIAMFSYDMLDTAPYNLGWQTHFLNLVYSPRKAVSSIIAAQATRELPRYAYYGDYPDNKSFGGCRVSYEQDASEFVSDEVFLYANDTTTKPPRPEALKRIVGAGSSPLVDYEGCGAYFLDKLRKGVWRLEVYPDAVIVQDPFAQKLNYSSVCSRLIGRNWPMIARIPDLPSDHYISKLTDGSTLEQASRARGWKMTVGPGVYLLSSRKIQTLKGLPEKVGRLGIGEFVCPTPPRLSPQILARLPRTLSLGERTVIQAEVLDTNAPAVVELHIQQAVSPGSKRFSLRPKRGYLYDGEIPAGALTPGEAQCWFSAKTSEGETRFPKDPSKYLTIHVVKGDEPITLLDVEQDAGHLAFTRIGDGVRHGIFEKRKADGPEPAALRLFLPMSYDRSLDDYTMSLGIKQALNERRSDLGRSCSLTFRARAQLERQTIHITLVEADGTSWAIPLRLSTNWTNHSIPLSDLRIACGVKLPLGYPERWNYWLTPAKDRGGIDDRIQPHKVEHIQISLRPERRTSNAQTDPWVDIANVVLLPE